MPSIRSCIASLAIMALAFSPIAAAASPKSGSLVARNANKVARSQIKASAALARRAAAKKAAAKASRTARKGKSGSSTAAPVAAFDPYAANSKFLNTKAALAARQVRCAGPGADARCERLVGSTAPADASAVCIAGRCTFRCDAGFAPADAQATTCSPQAVTCGAETCPTVVDGFNKCNAAGQCEPGCPDFNPPRQNSATGVISCFDYTSDPDHCGTYASNQVCPGAYSGQGARSCRRGLCSLSCAAGSSLRRTSTGDLYCY